MSEVRIVGEHRAKLLSALGPVNLDRHLALQVWHSLRPKDACLTSEFRQGPSNGLAIMHTEPGNGNGSKRRLPGNRADRGCVASGGQHHLAGNGADFLLVLKLETS